MPELTEVQRALEVLFRAGNVYHKPPGHDDRPMNIEDCWVCGINRSICMDTKCPGDYRLLVEAGFYG
jgi:hypothetical protein